MSITIFSPVDALKRAANSKGVNTGLIADNEYLGFVAGHARAASQAYAFQQIGAHYTLLGYGGLCLYATGTPYAETGGVSSTFYCGWDNTAPSIIVTAGTQTGTTLTVTAIPIDYRTMLIDFVEMLIGHAARDKDSISLGGASTGFTTVMDKLLTWQQQIRGAVAV